MNFVQAHARTDHRAASAEPAEPADNAESSVAARRLEEEVLRLDQSAGRRRLRGPAPKSTRKNPDQLRRDVAEINQSALPDIPKTFQVPPADGVELDASVSQSAQIWFEQPDGSQLRLDPPEHAGGVQRHSPSGEESRLHIESPKASSVEPKVDQPPATKPLIGAETLTETNPLTETNSLTGADPSTGTALLTEPETDASETTGQAGSLWDQWIGQPIDVMVTVDPIADPGQRALPPVDVPTVETGQRSEVKGNLASSMTGGGAESSVPVSSGESASPPSMAAPAKGSPEPVAASEPVVSSEPSSPTVPAGSAEPSVSPDADSTDADSPDADSTDADSSDAVSAERPWVPAWQVPAFPLPEVAESLFFQSDTDVCRQLAGRLAEAHRSGLETIAITSVGPGEGRSTVALGLALSVALSGLRVALVDADSDGGTLAEDLSLDLDHGWIDAIRGDVPLEEVAVASEADQITLIPLLERPGDVPPRPMEIRQLISRLRRHFDLILIDCPPSATDTVMLCHTALIVRDMQRTGPEAIESFALTLRRNGLHGIGVVENFSVGSSPSADASSRR